MCRGLEFFFFGILLSGLGLVFVIRLVMGLIVDFLGLNLVYYGRVV